MDAPAQYLEELRSELGLYPTWLPGEAVELGSFGTIRGGSFVVDGRLSDLDIVVVPKQEAEVISLKKSRGIKFHAATSTTAKAGLIDAEIGVELEIERAYAWAFAASGVVKTQIDNIGEVQRAVLEAFRAGNWRRRWLVVSELRKADHLNVLIARSKSTKGRVRGKGTVASALDILLQEDASFELSTDDVFKVPNAKHTTPLYGLRKLKGFFDPHVKPIRGGDVPRGAAATEDSALEVAPDESFFSTDTDADD